MRTITTLTYFLYLGSGFILIEGGLVRKLSPLLGSPSDSISIVLASLILAMGIGAIFSNSLFRSGTLTVRRTSASIAVYLLIGSVLYDTAVETVIALPLPIRCVVVFLILMPLGFLMGQLFPQGFARVSREDVRLVPWAWAIYSATSTLLVGAGYLLSYAFGFNALIYCGAAFYVVLPILPLAQRKPIKGGRWRRHHRAQRTPI